MAARRANIFSEPVYRLLLLRKKFVRPWSDHVPGIQFMNAVLLELATLDIDIVVFWQIGENRLPVSNQQ